MKTTNEIKDAIIQGRVRESSDVEFISTLPKDIPQLVITMVAMANSGGGYIILGIEDENGNGIRIKGYLNNDFSSILYNETNNYSIGVKYELNKIEISGAPVYIIKVEDSNETSYFVRHKTSPERLLAYKRENTRNVTISSMRYSKVYKYMTLESFITSLYTGKWRFFEPNKWDDKFERRFYCANYQLAGTTYHPQQLFATCVTKARNSEAAWKVYSHGQGLGAHCVQLELDIVELRKQLRGEMLSNYNSAQIQLQNNCQYTIVEKLVEYKPENYILKLHQKTSKDYSLYFQPFNLNKFLSLLSLKREAYAYEQEIRIFAIPQTTNSPSLRKKALCCDMKVIWNKLIKSVRIDKNCSHAEMAMIQQACHFANINPIVKKYQFITGLTKPSGSIDIDFNLYNIDDMPGSQRITIN